MRFDLLRDRRGVFGGLFDGQAGLGTGGTCHAGALVADLGHPGVEKDPHPLIDQLADLDAMRGKQGFGRGDTIELRAEELGEEFSRHDPVTLAARMHSIIGKRECRVLGATLIERLAHRPVEIHHIPSRFPFREQPLRVAR